MPGRVSTRTSTASRISRKSSVPTLNSRASTSSRISSQAVVIPDEGASTALRVKISSIFADAQKTTAGHRKLVTSLRKVQEACCYEPSKPDKKGAVGFEEEDFNAEVARCAIRLLGVKKSETVGDRVVRFLGMFLRQASEKGRISSFSKMIKRVYQVFQMQNLYQRVNRTKPLRLRKLQHQD